MEIRLLYITVGSMAEATKIGRTLVAERWVACVNIIDNVASFYWWEGKLQDDREVILIAKTTLDRVPAVIERVKSLHSYTCPCIVTLPIEAGNPAFLGWIAAEVGACTPVSSDGSVSGETQAG